MLGKLLKYDLKYMNKSILPLCLASIIMSAISRLFYELMDVSIIFTILYWMSIIVSNTLIANVLVHTFIRIIMRFRNNLYGDESYLTHTLPVKRRQLFLSKFIMSNIYIIISVVVVVLCLGIEYYTKTRFDILKEFLESITNTANVSLGEALTRLIIYLIVMFEWIQLMVFVSIELGYRKNDKKGLWSFIYAGILYLVTDLANVICIGILTLCNSEMKEAITTNTMPGNTFEIMITGITIWNLLYVIFYYVLGQKLLNKKLDIE